MSDSEKVWKLGRAAVGAADDSAEAAAAAKAHLGGDVTPHNTNRLFRLFPPPDGDPTGYIVCPEGQGPGWKPVLAERARWHLDPTRFEPIPLCIHVKPTSAMITTTPQNPQTIFLHKATPAGSSVKTFTSDKALDDELKATTDWNRRRWLGHLHDGKWLLIDHPE